MQQENALSSIAATLAHLTGMHVTIYDEHMHSLYTSGPKIPHPCDALHACIGCLDQCFASDVSAKKTVDETKSPYVYICPFGLIEILVPVMDHGRIDGYVMLGKALPAGQKHLKNAQSLMCEPFEDDETAKQEILQKLCFMTRLSEQDIEACTHMAAITAAHIEDRALLRDTRVSLGKMVRSIIKRNYHQKLTLSMLSLELHCSTVTLTEAFRKEFGITIMQYLNELRMEQAERLLCESNAPVSQIAEHCGFSDAGYFTRRFTAKHGLSPSAFRLQRQDTADNPST